MDQARALFEQQFGSDWSQPVVSNVNEQDSDSEKPARKSSSQPRKQSRSEPEESEEESQESEKDSEDEEDEEEEEDEGPITAKHNEEGAVVHSSSKADRKRFMAAKAPREAIKVKQKQTKEDEEDIHNDLALQRMIEESHILAKHQDFSGADISSGDPLEAIGKKRVKIMEARLAKAGAQKKTEKMPMAMAKGIKQHTLERSKKMRGFAKEAGIILAHEKKVRRKRVHDKGLKINSVGKATAHGVTVSPAEIARFKRKRK